MSDVLVTFEASEALFERGVAEPDQPESVHLGPFEWVQLTYEFLRIAPDGDHIAAFDPERGVWQLLKESDFAQAGGITIVERPKASDEPVFSDVSIAPCQP